MNVISLASATMGNESDPAPFRARTFLDSDRYRELDRRQAYFDCTQHDYKRYDFDGRIIQGGSGMGLTQPMLSAEKAAYFIPLRSRRPSSPIRMCRLIVNAFTNMTFGEGRFPKLIVENDPKSQDFIQTISRVGGLPVKMIRARTLGGTHGTACISWCFLDGKPRFEVHNAKNIWVHSWEDREQHIPKHVTECYLFPKDEWDSEKRKVVRNQYWYRRDWTPNADIVFKHARAIVGEEPVWVPNVDKSVTHDDKLCHFVWIQNMPSDEQDGRPDSDGLYENFDTIDLIYSVITRGAALNLDPTLVLKMDADLVNRLGVKKGSDNALTVGAGGEAKYLEIGGQSITAGISLFDSLRRSILEVARCVIPDPHEVAAQGVSSVALKAIYAPMLGQTDILREQYGHGLKRLLEPVLVIARKASSSTVTIYDEEGNEEEVQPSLDLPPRIEKTPKEDEDGKPTGEHDIEQVEREPGEGGEIDTQWGPYFAPTPLDQQQIVTTLSTAVAQAAIMSTQSATEILMSFFGREGSEEVARVQKAQVDADAKQAEMFPGGAPPGPGGGFPPKGGKGGFGKKPPPKFPAAPKPPPAQGGSIVSGGAPKAGKGIVSGDEPSD